MEKFVKVVELMVALGYSSKIARSQATSQMKKIEKLNADFGDSDYRKAIHILTIEEAQFLVNAIAESKSKYKENASNLIKTGFGEDLLTTDENYVAEKPKKAKVFKPKKADLEKYLEIKGLSDDFIEWFKASKTEA